MKSSSKNETQAEEPNDIVDVTEILRHSPLFADLPDELIHRIVATSVVINVESGKRVIMEGAESAVLYIILGGQVAIQVESINPPVDVSIARLGRGDVIAEGGLLGREGHAASAAMLSPGKLAAINVESMLEILREDAHGEAILYRNLAMIISKRLHRTNRRVLNLTRVHFFS